jgi:general secretion pathway protein G
MRGFTLIELILVSAMIGILAVIALPTYSYMVTKAKVSRAEADLRTLEKDVTAYLIDKGTLPSSLNAIGRGDLRDPWNRPYQYVNFALGGSPYQDFLASSLNTDFDLYSMGKDGISTQSLADASCADDIIRAGDGGFIGLGNEF